MKVVCISDTHNKHDSLLPIEDGDVLVHSGDATLQGSTKEVASFIEWFSRQPHKNKIFVPGNHDWLFQLNPKLASDICSDNGITLLLDKSVMIDGYVFYGSPWQPEFFKWAFNLPRGHMLADKWSEIPDDVNVLITHGPPHGILDQLEYNDERVGCQDLADRILKLKELKLHVFGHIHCDAGEKWFSGVKYVNASVLDDRYRLRKQEVIVEL
jgi:Icc-related predicted phosphoesterase